MWRAGALSPKLLQGFKPLNFNLVGKVGVSGKETKLARPLLHVKINGHIDALLLVDTGSTLNLVDRTLFKNVRCESTHSGHLIGLLGGKTIESLGEIECCVTATLRTPRDRHVTENLIFQMVELGDSGYQGILGLNGIKDLKLNFSFDGTLTSELPDDFGSSGETTDRNAPSAFLTDLKLSEKKSILGHVLPESLTSRDTIVKTFPKCFCEEVYELTEGASIVAPRIKLKDSDPICLWILEPHKLVESVAT